jgi:hypothetical protein
VIPTRTMCFRPWWRAAVLFIVGVAALHVRTVGAQLPVGSKRPPVKTRQFDSLAEGPYNRLVLRNVMVIPGHGSPPTGPHDILIEGNTIREIRSFAPASPPDDRPRWTGDRVIEGTGLYVMPGLIDLHHHTREEPLPLDYTYYLKLAHGVTAGVPGADARTDEVQRHHEMAERYEKLAPRMFPIWRWGRGTKATLAEQEDPAQAPRIAREMRASGAHVVDVGRGAPFWTPKLLAAVCAAVTEEGGITTRRIATSSGLRRCHGTTGIRTSRCSNGSCPIRSITRRITGTGRPMTSTSGPMRSISGRN